ncbi:MAG TPA: glycosyltransferase family 87 protein [Terriglobales bacterium]|nr:glycosyltransferase family 87 protein [Terriglobales bacterium]
MKNSRFRPLWWLALVSVLAAYLWMVAGLRQKILEGRMDFTAFYTGARLVADGRGADLYDARVQAEYQRNFAGRQTPLLFNHPPFELVLLLPLAWLPFPHAYAAWMGVNLALLVWLACLRHPYTRQFPYLRGLPTLVAAAALFPVAWAMMQGQDSIPLLLLFALAWIALRRGQPFRAGCFLALGLFKFQLVVPFMVALIVRRMWPAVRGFVLTGAALAAVSALLVGWTGLWRYVEFLQGINQSLAYGAIRPVAMPNVRGAVTMSVGTVLPAPWPTVLIASLSLLLLILAARKWPRAEDAADARLDLAFALNLMVSLLVSYHLNPHDLALLFLAMALVAQHLAATRGERRWSRTALLASMVVLYVPTLYVPEGMRLPHPMFWLLLLLTIGLAAETSRQRPQETNQPHGS